MYGPNVDELVFQTGERAVETAEQRGRARELREVPAPMDGEPGDERLSAPHARFAAARLQRPERAIAVPDEPWRLQMLCLQVRSHGLDVDVNLRSEDRM